MMVTPRPHPAIFVNIASFRDPECQWTVKDLFEKAAHPERVFVGICWQFDPAEDTHCFAQPYPRAGQVREYKVDYRESRGANWARDKAQSLWQGEEYVLQIDSHMRFEPGWDETLVGLLENCPSPKPVLSSYLPNYEPPDEKTYHSGKLLRLRLHKFGEDSDPQLLHLRATLVPLPPSDEPLYPTPFYVGNFMFARAATLQEVPFDPYIQFWGDEINYAARLWTHGYDIFQLNQVVLHHFWARKSEWKLHDYRRNRQGPQGALSRARLRHVLGLEPSTDAAVLADIKRYGLGAARPLAQLWQFAGVDWKNRRMTKDALQGRWHMAKRKTAKDKTAQKKTDMTEITPVLPRIFVNIVSYRDAECQWTVKDLFEKAAHPERINVGICWQFDPAEDAHCFVEPCPRPKQVRAKQFHSNDSVGAGWARNEAQSLAQGEDYTLQIQAHMRFEPDWDTRMIAMLERCPSAKPAISTYVLPYTPPDNLSKIPGETLRVRIHSLTDPQNAQLINLTRVTVPFEDTQRSSLYPCPFWIGNFLFASTHLFDELPSDPHIYFYGEEIAYSARLFTHGWDVFQPDEVLIYHYWRRPETAQFNYSHALNPRNAKALERIMHLLQIKTATNAEALFELERYDIGRERTLDQLWRFAGIDWVSRQWTKDASEGRWNLNPSHRQLALSPDAKAAIPSVNTMRQGASVPKETTAQKIKSGAKAIRLPRIFVNIASYRDSECQWTVKDLFEKAAHPERIFVGICWQFDPVEDAHCFQVVTRPDQVRVMPVDWRDAEGVCWARYNTQLLWEDEEYTLMIDSHMRFVPGWDELMIAELADCDSKKPVLSCSPSPYVPPNQLSTVMKPTIRRVKPFTPEGNMRCQGEQLQRAPEKPLRGAFLVANFVFSRSDIINEVPYDPYLYFDQEEISYAARLFTYGWDIFSTRQQFLYHFYNDKKIPGAPERPLHWHDLHKKDSKSIAFLRDRGLMRFNHLTGHALSTDPKIIAELDKFGFGTQRSLQEFEEYTGIDFKRKIASEKATHALFIKDLHKYRDIPIHVPETGGAAPKVAQRPTDTVIAAPSMTVSKAAPHIIVPPAQPPMMEMGDFMPLFEVFDSHMRKCAIEVYAGRHCVLFFLPTDPEFLAAFMNYVRQSPKQHDIWQIFIINETPEALKALQEKIGTKHAFWSDRDGKLARSLGLSVPGKPGLMSPVGFVLNQNLKITHRHLHSDPVQLATATFNDCYRDIRQRNAKNANQMVFSEIAPALIVPDAFTPEFCRKCIQVFHAGNTFEGTVGVDASRAYRPGTKVRTDYIVQSPLLEEIDEKLSRSLFPEMRKVFGFEVRHRELYKIGVYKGEKGGFFKQHRDNFDAPLGYRRVAMTLHLTDDYEGGGLRFPEYDEHVYRPALGSAIAFSCGTMHEARPVTAGERFVLVGFFHGEEDEHFRRHYAVSQGKEPHPKNFLPTLRQYPGIALSRDFYTDWKKNNVRYADENPPPAVIVPVT
jgi:glycosyltransferase involved in cell wall biosynthesis/peroxiredoxin/predicted 2-oxoglutarate/Fe(II)-dependent dioxygenase YbiX